MTINERIAAIETELDAAMEKYNAAYAAYDAYDLDPTHFKDADRSERMEELRNAISAAAVATKEIGSRLDAAKKEKMAASHQGQRLANLFKSFGK